MMKVPPAAGLLIPLAVADADDVLYLEIGDRTAGDSVTYPDDDIAAVLDKDGRWQFAHKDGTPY